MRRSGRKGVVYRLAVAAYIVVFAIPLMSGQLFYHIASEMLIDEIGKNNAMLLASACDEVSDTLDALQRAGLDLSQNADIRNYLSGFGALDANSRYTTRDAILNFATLSSTIDLADTCLLYKQGERTLLTISAKYDADLFWRYKTSAATESLEHCLNWLDSFQDYYRIQLIDVVNESGDTVPEILIAQSIPKEAVSHGRGVFLALIPQRALIDRLSGYLGNGLFAIWERDGALLAASDGFPEGLLDLQAGANAGATVNGDDGERYIATYRYIDSHGWIVACLVEEQYYHAALHQGRKSYYLIFAVSLLLGLLIIFYLANKQYSPVATLVNQLNGEASEGSDNRNEYEFIHGSINSMMAEKRKLQQQVFDVVKERSHMIEQINRSRELMQSSLLLGFMRHPTQDSENLPALLAFYDVPLTEGAFVVLRVRLQGGMGNRTIFYDLLRSYLTHSNDVEKAKDAANIYVVEDGEASLNILLNAPVGARMEDELTRARSVILDTAERLNLIVDLAVGTVVRSASHIHESYDTACRSIEERAVVDGGKPSETDASADRDPLGRLSLDEALVQRGEQGYTDQIWAEYAGEDGERRQEVLYKAAYESVRLLQNLGAPEEEVAGLEARWKALPFATGEMAAIRKELQGLMKETARVYGQCGREKRPVISAEQISVYIEDHLTDPMLSQGGIADHFGISAYNLSRIFKREFQIGMNDYINNARVVRSLPYLMDKSLSLNDVAQRVGFNNSHTLIRVFKKFEQITPGEYRNKMGAGGEDEAGD